MTTVATPQLGASQSGVLRAAPPQILVVFGASGDLTRRKVLPALYNLARERHLPERFAVVGYARSDWSADTFRAHARRAVEEFSRTPLEEGPWRRFSDSLHYVSGSFDDPNCFAPLMHQLAALDDQLGTNGARLYYCATPPSAFPLIVSRLGECQAQERSRIVIEKPFGSDLLSAQELNRTVHRVFDESQVFRIDHYLGKETVQNLLVFRFANSMFERVWNRDAIDHVQITVAESVGVEGRGSYYEEAGATKDMMQNHLLQVLSFVAMEPPRSLEPDAIRDEKVKLLRALRPLDPAEVVRGQYVGGEVEGRSVPGYRDEKGVDPRSSVETFGAARAWIDNWRWGGVPFYLRTGKRLPRRATEVLISFREAPGYLFEGMGLPRLAANHLHIAIQPDEGMSFAFHAKEPGPGFLPQIVRMQFSYGESFKKAPAEAYERLVHDAMAGDHTLFTREDGIERSWEIVAPLLGSKAAPVPYRAGTWGPAEADRLIAPRTWHMRARTEVPDSEEGGKHEFTTALG
jgi:glucose-6-phosphate 1-dehydrogenase